MTIDAAIEKLEKTKWKVGESISFGWLVQDYDDMYEWWEDFRIFRPKKGEYPWRLADLILRLESLKADDPNRIWRIRKFSAPVIDGKRQKFWKVYEPFAHGDVTPKKAGLKYIGNGRWRTSKH